MSAVPGAAESAADPVTAALTPPHDEAAMGGADPRRYLNAPFVSGATIIVVLLIGAFVVPALSAYDAWVPDAADALQGPSGTHLFGTDVSGFDMLTRCFYAARIDIAIAAGGVIAGAAIGVAMGVVAGYARGLLGEAALRFVDLAQAFPLLVLALAIVSLAGASWVNLVVAIAFINVPIFLRLVRSRVLSIREQGYAEMAVAVGNSPGRVVFAHILPNALGPAIVQLGISLGHAIIIIAGLGFLGVGLAVPTPEWGAMIHTGATQLTTGQWWTFVFPGLFLAVTVAAFNLLSEGIEIAREV